MSKFSCYVKHLEGKSKSAEVTMSGCYKGMLYVNAKPNLPSYYELVGPGGLVVYLSDYGLEMISPDGSVLTAPQIKVVLENFPINGITDSLALPSTIALLPQLLTNQRVVDNNFIKPVLYKTEPKAITLHIVEGAWDLSLPIS